MSFRIPVYQPSLDGNEKKYVAECLDSTWISSKGKFLTEFESKFATYTGVEYATCCSNGTVALHLALLALGIGPGDEVIVPTLTYIASVNAITYTGATPVFVDSLRETWQMDPDGVRQRLTPRTKAILCVHLYGHPCDMDALTNIASENGVFLLEDCAEAVGTKFKNRHVGSFGDIGIYSFFGNKTITTGEGGMVVANDRKLIERAIHFKGQGLAAGREYWHDIIGYNYRMTNICAAIGLAQLERVDEILRSKRRIRELYAAGLTGVPVELQPVSKDVKHSHWMVCGLTEKLEQRDALRENLAENGIETRPVFNPIHTMPIYSSCREEHPIAEDLARRGINLPSWPDLEDQQIEQITGLIGRFYA